MKDKRKYKRMELFTFAESEMFAASILGEVPESAMKQCISQSFFQVYNSDSGGVCGQMINISLGGMMIIGLTPFHRDTIGRFFMDFSQLIDIDHSVSFTARCTWIENHDEFECYMGGFEFIEIDKGDVETLRKLFGRFNGGD